MFVPRFLRLDNMEPTAMTSEEMRPYVEEAMKWYLQTRIADYGEDLLPWSEGIDTTLSEHYFVLINGEYLLAYSVSGEWFHRRVVLTEEYIYRLKKGTTTLSQVFDVLRLMGKLHRAREVFVCPEKAALRRLYERHGAKDSINFMRIT